VFLLFGWFFFVLQNYDYYLVGCVLVDWLGFAR